MMITISKFIYDLAGHPKPSDGELDEEIDLLLFIKGVEEPNYLSKNENRDQLSILDSSVISSWIERRFQPALILLLLDLEDNHYKFKSELLKMERFSHIIDKYLRINFIRKRARQRVLELSYDEPGGLDLQTSILNIKKTLVILADHLQKANPEDLTLLGTDTYTSADITLYNYLKRIIVGKYEDMGIKTHVKLSEPLKKFMSRYARKNANIVDVSSVDPLATPEETGLLQDAIKPVAFAVVILLFFLWRRN